MKDRLNLLLTSWMRQHPVSAAEAKRLQLLHISAVTWTSRNPQRCWCWHDLWLIFHRQQAHYPKNLSSQNERHGGTCRGKQSSGKIKGAKWIASDHRRSENTPKNTVVTSEDVFLIQGILCIYLSVFLRFNCCNRQLLQEKAMRLTELPSKGPNH